MPAAAPIVLGAAFSAVSISTVAGALVVGFSLTAFAGSLILGAVSYALTPKPQKPGGGLDSSSLSNKGQTVAVRQPDLTRQYIFGHTRITRGYAHMESTGVNGVLHAILILCEGQLRSINEIWMNDYCIPPDWIDSEGNVTQGRYAGKLIIRKHLGSETQAADSLAITNMSPWTSDHRLQGTAYLYLVMTKDQDVYPTGVPNVTAIVEGMTAYDPRTESDTWTTNIAIHAHNFIRNNDYGFGAFEDDVDLTNIAAQANICDEIVNTNTLTYTVESVSGNLISLSGDILELQFGDRVQITGSDVPAGLSTGTNYYVIPYQVKDNPRIGLATTLDNAMNKVFINLIDSGSGVMSIFKNGEPRYHGGGAIDTETGLSQTLNDMVSCMAGRAVCVGGFWTLLAGAWRTPDLTLTVSDMRSGYGVKNALSMAESYNVVKGLYVSSINMYQSSDYPSASYPAFITQDNGLEAIKDINLPYCNRPTTAQRIAKIELFRGRQDISLTCDFSTKALQLKPGDTVNFDMPSLGWENKVFEVTQFSFDVNNGNLITRLSVRETAQAIYDWSSGEAINFDPAPNTNLPNPFNVMVPTGVNYNSREIGTRDGDVVYSLTLNWNQHPDQFVTQFGDFEIQWKLSSEPDWRPSFFVDGLLTQTDVVNSTVNVQYDLRIRARNNLGVRSNWVTILGAVVGSSGGVGETRDYEGVFDPVVYSFDYGSVEDAVTDSEDWGFVN